MLGTATALLSPLDLSALLQYVATALLIGFGFLALLKNAVSRYFVVDTGFDSVPYGEGRGRSMSIIRGGKGDDEGDDEKCFVCGKDALKHCGRCKSVRYCSPHCQRQHWDADHKTKCRKKVSGLVALVPGHRMLKVLQQPKKILFPYDEFIKLYYWEKQVFPPCGLLNCGNSCFANVVLQCLSCTRPLVGYLLEGVHSRQCRRNSWCFFCELQSHIQRVSLSSHPFSPVNILSQLPNIGCHLGYGRQEDAHEFMRFAIDTMQSVCLDEFGGEKALDPSTQETSLIQYIFGGVLQSQVTCTNCNVVSNRYENMMDLTVEIQGDAESLEDCLIQFTAKEWLDGENMYKCDECKDYVKAVKRLTVHHAPNILTVTLKRFQGGRFGKLNKRVAFPETLDLGPYMSCTGEGDDLYVLYAVVVHLDMLNASFFGHYICYTKDFRGNWYRIDDCKVMKVELEEVLSQGAYMLLYGRLHVRQPKSSNVAKGNDLQAEQLNVPSDISDPMSNVIIKNISINSETGTENEGKKYLVNERVLDSTFYNPQRVEREVNEENSLSLKELAERKFSPTSSCSENKTVETQLPLQKFRENCPLPVQESTSNLGLNESEMVAAPVVSTFSQRSMHENSEMSPSVSHSSVSSTFDQATEFQSSCEREQIESGPSYDNTRKEDPLGIDGRSKCRVEIKPVFSRGFLDRSSKKKPLNLAKKVQTVNHPVKPYTENGLPEVRHSVCGNSKSAIDSHKDLDVKERGQSENGRLDAYKDDSKLSKSSASDTVKQTSHDHNSFQKTTIGISKANDYHDLPSAPIHPHREPQRVDVSSFQVNGERSPCRTETRPVKEMESVAERHDAHQILISAVESGSLPISNGFFNKDFQESPNAIHVERRDICKGVGYARRGKQVLESSQPKGSKPLQADFLNHEGLHNSVPKMGDENSDAYMPVDPGSETQRDGFCKEHDSVSEKPSMMVSSPKKFERAQFHVSCLDSSCPSNINSLSNNDVLNTRELLTKHLEQLHENSIGQASVHESGCSSITKSNGCFDTISE